MKETIKALSRGVGIRHLGASTYALRRFFFSFIDAFGSLLIGASKPFLPIEKKDVHKILLLRLDRVGDLVLTTPAIRAVRKAYPNARIDLMVKEYTKDIVTGNPHVNRVLCHSIDRLDKDYDLAIAFHPGFGANRLLFKSGANRRIGYDGGGGTSYLTHVCPDDRATRVRHEVESALEIAKLAGAEINENDRALEVPVQPEAALFADRFLKQNALSEGTSLIGIHPGARQPYIRWSKEGFAQVADELSRRHNAKVLLFSGDQETALAQEIERCMKNKPLLVSGLSIAQLVALIKRCCLFIGNSTGPTHIAAALKVPVVAIFGPVHPLDSFKEWGPWGEGNAVVSKHMQCSDCHPTDCGTFDCMRLITAKEVLGAAERLLEIK